MMNALVNARIVTENGIIGDGVLLHDGGKIKDIGRRGEIAIPEGTSVLDCKGLFAGPGLVDIHCHGGGTTWFYEDPAAAARHHLLGGTTSLCCTLYHSQDFDTTMRAIEMIRGACESGLPGNIVGIHFEGPYLSPKYGASSKTARKPDPAEYRAYLKSADGLIRQWSFAPEVEGVEPFVDEVLGRGIPMSFAHSEAGPALIFKYAAKGVSICTHIMDATGCSISPTRWPGTREVGFDEAVMLCRNVMTEVIPDELGIHVRALMCKFLLQAVGIDRIAVITDCTAFDAAKEAKTVGAGETGATGQPDACDRKDPIESADINIVNGEVYGSRLLMCRAVRNFMAHTGIGIADAFRVGASNPARAIHLQDQSGSLAVGKRANVILVDDEFNLKTVMLDGQVAVQDGHIVGRH